MGTWQTRAFTRDTLRAVFPNKTDDIDKLVDPGEYALEDYNCRLVCSFLFVVGIVSDWFEAVNMGYLIWSVPSRVDLWVVDNTPEWDTRERIQKIQGKSVLQFTQFRVAGLALAWKVFNTVVVL